MKKNSKNKMNQNASYTIEKLANICSFYFITLIHVKKLRKMFQKGRKNETSLKWIMTT